MLFDDFASQVIFVGRQAGKLPLNPLEPLLLFA
jgi:hypothetical protein